MSDRIAQRVWDGVMSDCDMPPVNPARGVDLIAEALLEERVGTLTLAAEKIESCASIAIPDVARSYLDCAAYLRRMIIEAARP